MRSRGCPIRLRRTTMTKRELEARLKELEQKLAAKNEVTFKVSPRGAVSVYGLMRFPVTLYKGQWERLLDHQDELRAFIKANESRLKVKRS